MPKIPQTGRKYSKKQNKAMLYETSETGKTHKHYNKFNPIEEDQTRSRGAKKATQARKLEREESDLSKADHDFTASPSYSRSNSK